MWFIPFLFFGEAFTRGYSFILLVFLVSFTGFPAMLYLDYRDRHGHKVSRFTLFLVALICVVFAFTIAIMVGKS